MALDAEGRLVGFGEELWRAEEEEKHNNNASGNEKGHDGFS
jgi:hypothetical protein